MPLLIQAMSCILHFLMQPWLIEGVGNKLHKIHCSRFLCTLTVVHGHGWKFYYCFTFANYDNSAKVIGHYVILFLLLARGIPVLITNNDILRAVLPIENVCVQSFGHIKWALKIFVHGETLFNLQVGSLFTTFEVFRLS